MSFFTSFKKLVGIIKLHEGIINEKHINLNLISHFGLLSQSKKTAYDPFNKLLAVGSDHGIIKIYGRSGIEITVHTKNNNSSLESLCFISEQERIVIAFKSKIEVWNLNSISKEFEITYENKNISTVVYSPLANVIYVGFKDGDIFTINTSNELWQKALYKIEFNKAWPLDSEPSKILNREVISILINPERDDYIVIGYALGVIEWDIKARKTLRIYRTDIELSSLCWDIKHTHTYAGYKNGEIALWKHKKMTAEEIFRLSNEEIPVNRIIVASYNGERLIIYHGGIQQKNILTIEYYASKSKNRKSIKVFSNDNEIIDLHLIYKSPSSQSDPIAITCISDKGDISILSFMNLNLQKMPSPIAHMFHQSKIVSSKLVRVSHLFHDDIINTSRLKYQCDEWPISGGEFKVENPKPTLLVTGNSDNNVYIWDVSLKSTMHLITLLNISIAEDDSISCVEFCPVSREFFAGTKKGCLFHYIFSLDEAKSEVDEISENSLNQNDEVPLKDSSTDEKECTTESSKTELLDNADHESPKIEQNPESLNTSTNENNIQDKNYVESKDSSKNDVESKDSSKNDETNQIPPQITQNKPYYPNQFYLKHKLELDCNISSIVYESGLGYLAIGSDSGDIIVYKMDSNPITKIMHLRISSHIASISFCETLVRENNTILLILCCINGEIFYFDMNTKEMLTVPNKNTLFIKNLIVTPKGRHLHLRKRVWKSDKKEKLEYTGRDTFKDEKYLIHCTVNEIVIYNIPNFEIVQKVKTPAPISWFGNMTVNLPTKENPKNEESCLFGIDHSLNLHMWTLMDLREILKMKKLNTLKTGAFNISPMEMKSSCTLMDGSFYLFSEKSESFFFNLTSYIDQRAYHTLITSKNINMKNKSTLRGVRQLLGSKKEVDFEKLFGEVEKTPIKVNDSKPTNNSNEKLVIQSTSEVTKTLREVTERLDERGEKLNQLSEKTSEMAMNSASFAEKARKLAEMQKKRSWF